jgi:hypothetical protein
MKKELNIVLLLILYCTISTAQSTVPDSARNGGAMPGEPMRPVTTAPGWAGSDTLRPPAKVATLGKRKSVKKAFFLSLAVPGAGEYYTGNARYTRGFLTAEGVVWSVWLLSNFQERMWRRDYIGYAAQEAGSNPTRDDDAYYTDLYEWPNSDWYNEYQWAEARDLYPNDPAAQASYVADKLYTGADSWEWQTTDDWDYFRSLRVKSLNSKQRKNYAMGAALLNRLLSAVNAARLAKSYNKAQARKRRSLELDLNLYPTPEGRLAVAMSGRF